MEKNDKRKSRYAQKASETAQNVNRALKQTNSTQERAQSGTATAQNVNHALSIVKSSPAQSSKGSGSSDS